MQYCAIQNFPKSDELFSKQKDSVLKDPSVCHVPAPQLHSCGDYAQLQLQFDIHLLKKKKKRKKGKKMTSKNK